MLWVVEDGVAFSLNILWDFPQHSIIGSLLTSSAISIEIIPSSDSTRSLYIVTLNFLSPDSWAYVFKYLLGIWTDGIGNWNSTVAWLTSQQCIFPKRSLLFLTQTWLLVSLIWTKSGIYVSFLTYPFSLILSLYLWLR